MLSRMDRSSARELARLRATPMYRRLAELFADSGYVREPAAERLTEDRGYKKGWEVRFVVRSEWELREVRSLLVLLGFRPGRAYQHVGPRTIQPVYGRRAVELFSKARRR